MTLGMRRRSTGEDQEMEGGRERLGGRMGRLQGAEVPGMV